MDQLSSLPDHTLILELYSELEKIRSDHQLKIKQQRALLNHEYRNFNKLPDAHLWLDISINYESGTLDFDLNPSILEKLLRIQQESGIPDDLCVSSLAENLEDAKTFLTIFDTEDSSTDLNFSALNAHLKEFCSEIHII